MSLEQQVLQQWVVLTFCCLFSEQFVRGHHFLPPSNIRSVMHACTVVPILTTLVLNWHNPRIHHITSVMFHTNLNSCIMTICSKQDFITISQQYMRLALLISKIQMSSKHFISDRLLQGNSEECLYNQLLNTSKYWLYRCFHTKLLYESAFCYNILIYTKYTSY